MSTNKKKLFYALIPGYGIPKDIMKDRNYNTYLAVCFNTLFEKFQHTEGTVVLSGGYTDCYPPHKRTEAREMKRWFAGQMKTAEQAAGKKLAWKLVTDNQALTTIENIVNFNKLVPPRRCAVIFVDQTRRQKMRRYAKELFGKRAAVITVDFDISAHRYRTGSKTVRGMRNKDLEVGLRAIRDPKILGLRRKFAKRKLKAIREYGAEKGHEMLGEIIDELYNEFRDQLSR